MAVLLDIAVLDPNWGNGINANRSLHHDHVDNLIDEFGESMKRPARFTE